MAPRGNLLDRAIGYVAPGWGAQRARSRAITDLLEQRGYDGARVSRRTDGWTPVSSSANAEVGRDAVRLRDRSRDLVRNNPHMAKAITSLVANIIGTGIVPRADTGNDTLNKRIDAAFAQFVGSADADGQLDFYGLQTLACRAMIESGEVVLRRRPRRSSDGLAVPMQVQVLEADMLDGSRNGGLKDGGRVIQGVEFDPIDRRRAYWLYAQHPGELILALKQRFDSAAVPAADIAHVYEKTRPGQVRGVPWFAPVILKLRDIDNVAEAEVTRRQIEACTVAMVSVGDGDDDDPGIAPSVTDASGKVVEMLEPGLIAYMRGGKDIKFNQPASTGGYAEWLRVNLQIVAAGGRLPYELLTGDLSQVNYSSIRAGLVEFRRSVEAIQWHLFIPMACAPVWRWFVDAAFVAGLIPVAAYGVEWQPPRFESVDPLKDTMADLLAIRTGTRTLSQAIAAQGYSPQQQLAEIAAMNTLLDKLGLILDCDPRRIDKAGGAQATIALDRSGSGAPADDDELLALAQHLLDKGNDRHG